MEVASMVLLWGGVFFMVVTAVGIMRLPDFYSRAHAVSKTDTLGIGLVVLGLIIFEGASLVGFKLVIILVSTFVVNPLAAHLLTRAAVRSGVQAWSRESAGRPTNSEITPEGR